MTKLCYKGTIYKRPSGSGAFITTIPKPIANLFGIQKSCAVTFTLKNGKIIIEKYMTER